MIGGMRPRLAFVAALAAAVGLVLSPSLDALACQCGRQSRDKQYENATAVFVGHVLETSLIPPSRSNFAAFYFEIAVRLRVLEVLKESTVGSLGDETTLTTGFTKPSCGIRFGVGEVHVVFANPGEKFAMLTTSSCSGGWGPIANSPDEWAANRGQQGGRERLRTLDRSLVQRPAV